MKGLLVALVSCSLILGGCGASAPVRPGEEASFKNPSKEPPPGFTGPGGGGPPAGSVPSGPPPGAVPGGSPAGATPGP